MEPGVVVWYEASPTLLLLEESALFFWEEGLLLAAEAFILGLTEDVFLLEC